MIWGHLGILISVRYEETKLVIIFLYPDLLYLTNCYKFSPTTKLLLIQIICVCISWKVVTRFIRICLCVVKTFSIQSNIVTLYLQTYLLYTLINFFWLSRSNVKMLKMEQNADYICINYTYYGRLKTKCP